MQEKKCVKCSEVKPLVDFQKKGRDKNGGQLYRNSCKECYKMNWKYKIIVSIHNSVRRNGYKATQGEKITVKFLKELKERQNGKCYWLGLDLDFTRKNRFLTPSLDRIDSSKGYERDNVVLSCSFANLGRGESTENEMWKFLRLLSGHSEPKAVIINQDNRRDRLAHDSIPKTKTIGHERGQNSF